MRVLFSLDVAPRERMIDARHNRQGDGLRSEGLKVRNHNVFSKRWELSIGAVTDFRRRNLRCWLLVQSVFKLYLYKINK